MALDPDLVDRIRELVGTEQGITEKRMFGGLAFLVNGNMSVTASRTGGLMVRLTEEEAEALLDGERVRPFVSRGREIAGWLRLTPEVVEADDDLARWVAMSLRFARTLPAK